MGLASAFGGKSSTSKKLARKEKRLTDFTGETAINRAVRAKEEFQEQEPFQKAKVRGSFYARGLGKSSVATQGMGLYESARKRAVATLDEDEQMARLGADLQDYQHKAKKRFGTLELIDSILGTVQGGVGTAAGLGAFGGGDNSQG